MQNITGIFSARDDLPVELRYLRVAAYCRVSTGLEEQTSSIELQERHDSQLISGKLSLGKRRNIFRKSHRSESERTA